MAKNKFVYALSVTALVLGSGILAPVAWAEGECSASNLSELEACLAGDATSVVTTDTILVTGEGVDKVLVIDKTIDGASGKNVFQIEDGARLSLRGKGTINAGRYGAIADGAELIIDGVTINATNTESYGVYAKNNGRVTMSSGMVVADYAAFAGNNTTGDMNFYIEGGILKSNRYPAIYMPGQVDLVMRGGTLEGGIVVRMGQIAIEGGTINTQTNPVSNDGIDQNYSSMPSVANEAITLLAGTYKSDNAEYGNDMNVIISGENTRLNGDVVLYDLGSTASGYEQNVSVKIEDGYLSGFKTKFTQEEIGFTLKSGYTAGLNNSAGRIKVELSGGKYTTEPDEADLVNDSETEYEDGLYVIYPKLVDWKQTGIETDFGSENQIPVHVEFGNELIADRKATLSVAETDANDLILDETKGGELLGAINIDMLDRDNVKVEVNNNILTVYIEIDEDTYNELAAYDKLYMVYFNDNGVEEERFDVDLVAERVGEEENDYFYYVKFETTHLSTYGLVGVNGESTSNNAGTPNTGTVTAVGASATNAAIMTAVAVGLLTSIVSFAYLIRRR